MCPDDEEAVPDTHLERLRLLPDLDSALSGLFSAGSEAWLFQPVLTLPLFDAGRNRANLGVAEAGFGSYVKTYKPWFVGREAYLEREKTRHGEVVRFRFNEKGVRMACFDAKSGTRVWDVQVHGASNVETGLTVEAGRVYYASWTALYVLSLADGKRLFTIGYDF